MVSVVLLFLFFLEFWKQYDQQTFDVDVVGIVIVVSFGQCKPLIFCFVIPKIPSSKKHKMKLESNTTQHIFFSFHPKKKKCSVSISNFFSPSSKPSKHTNLSLFFFVFVGWACFWVLLFSKGLFCLFEQGHHISNGFHTKFLQPSLCFIETCFRCTKHCHIFTIHSLFTKSTCITSQLWIHFQPISNFFNSPFRWWFGVYSLWLIRWVTVNATNIGVYFYCMTQFCFSFCWQTCYRSIDWMKLYFSFGQIDSDCWAPHHHYILFIDHQDYVQTRNKTQNKDIQLYFGSWWRLMNLKIMNEQKQNENEISQQVFKQIISRTNPNQQQKQQKKPLEIVYQRYWQCSLRYRGKLTNGYLLQHHSRW